MIWMEKKQQLDEEQLEKSGWIEWNLVVSNLNLNPNKLFIRERVVGIE